LEDEAEEVQGETERRQEHQIERRVSAERLVPEESREGAPQTQVEERYDELTPR